MGRGGRKPSGGAPKTGNRHKWRDRNNGPARQRYWSSRRLRERKIKAMMQHNGLTRSEAAALWDATRKGRLK